MALEEPTAGHNLEGERTNGIYNTAKGSSRRLTSSIACLFWKQLTDNYESPFPLLLLYDEAALNLRIS